ncbi:MAG TPA: ABC transporter substrate-binding protein [Leptolyngbyaceae cyanobacterium M33_DOE_097]|uniref:ABC transporter substrate-binding protein n=1 Tax=Oscillatoriales cyanobacterium SpSt-418 TaxID=2282169 RepID=A0A7C3PM15_9CYAN|nr:ABC transporter substrate-binding protein [Leptolyngbyaceae cyanobacterium M33_DOE_097]
MKFPSIQALIPVLCLTLVGCTSPSSTSNVTTSPSSNPSLVVTSTQANRVIALTSISADILGHYDNKKLVGMTGSRLLAKDERFKTIPTVSQGRTPPNLEAIAALKPDLVIGAVGFHDQVLNRLKQIGTNTLATEINSWSDFEKLNRDLAGIVGADPSTLLARLNNCKKSKQGRSPSTLVLVSQRPILAPNKNSWAGNLLDQFKLKNVAGDIQSESPTKGYVTLSAEKVLEANPELLILVNTEPGTVEGFKKLPFWSQLKAVQTDQVYTFDYYGLINPGSIEKIQQMCNKLGMITSLSGTSKLSRANRVDQD